MAEGVAEFELLERETDITGDVGERLLRGIAFTKPLFGLS